MSLPLVVTKITTEFGDVLADDTLFDEQGGLNDLMYVPGFSDIRKAADLAKAQGRKPPELPANLRWVRRTKGDGKPTNQRTVQVSNNGYEYVKSADVGRVPYITEMPAGATKLADGTIGMGDMVLMVCTKERAARNQAKKTMRWLEQSTGYRDSALAKAGERIAGSNPEVTVEAGPTQK